MTTETKSNLDSLYFPAKHVAVEKLGFAGVPGRDHAVIVNPGSDNKIVSLCSEDYELVLNENIFPEIEAGLKGLDYTVQAKNYNDCMFKVDFIVPIEGLDFFKGDNLQMRIETWHSYDSRRRFLIDAGLWRQICGNGLAMPLEVAQAQDYKLEMSGMHSHDNVKEMLKSFTMWLPNVLESLPATAKEVYKPLNDRALTNYSERILEVVSATKVFSTKLVEDAVAVAQLEERAGGLRRSDWLAYNAINNLIFSDEVNKKDDFERKALDQKVVSYMLR